MVPLIIVAIAISSNYLYKVQDFYSPLNHETAAENLAEHNHYKHSQMAINAVLLKLIKLAR
jgi:hypothetical protein